MSDSSRLFKSRKYTDGDFTYINYIVTSVTIIKDQEKFRYYHDNGNQNDLDGFEVKLSLTEIDANYIFEAE